MNIIKLAIITNFFANLTMVMPTHGKVAYLALWTYWKIELFLLQCCNLFVLQSGASGTKTCVLDGEWLHLLHACYNSCHAMFQTERSSFLCLCHTKHSFEKEVFVIRAIDTCILQ